MHDFLREKYECEIIETPKEKPAKCDGFLVKSEEIVGLFESKCRYTTLSQFKEWGSLILTYDKVDKCAWLSNMLCVPFYVFIYVVETNNILGWKITDDEGNYLFNFEVKETVTKKCVNGGIATRENAYFPLSHAKILR